MTGEDASRYNEGQCPACAYPSISEGGGATTRGGGHATMRLHGAETEPQAIMRSLWGGEGAWVRGEGGGFAELVLLRGSGGLPEGENARRSRRGAVAVSDGCGGERVAVTGTTADAWRPSSLVFLTLTLC